MVNKFSRFGTGLKGATVALVQKTADDIVNDTIDSFKARKTGRKHRNLLNRSSAVGETPAWQTGGLANSITTDLDINPISVTATIKVNADYAKYLVGSGRPILSPAARKHGVLFKQALFSLSNVLSGSIK